MSWSVFSLETSLNREQLGKTQGRDKAQKVKKQRRKMMQNSY